MKILTGYWKFLKCKGIAIPLLVVGLLLVNNLRLEAQSDSLIVVDEGVQDTAHYKKLDPRKALFYSAILPGLGQIYNGKYWKLPFVYGGFFITISVVEYYQKTYHQYRNDLFIFIATGTSPSGRSETNLRYIVDKSRRQRDFYMIMSGVWYLLQAVDAHVDAHLQEFKINKELRVSVNPALEQSVWTGRTTGFSLTFKF